MDNIVIMAVVNPVHLMNADSIPDDPPLNQASQRGMWVHL